MRLSPAALALLITNTFPRTNAQTCSGVSGPFALEFKGMCNYATILEEYIRQVFEATGKVCTESTLTAEEDLNNKLVEAATSVERICQAAHDNREIT